MNTTSHRLNSRFSRRAFTLIELAVVNISIVSLVGLLMPALGEARKLARNAVSIANLNTLNQIHMTYAAENNGSFYNPWDENWTSPASGRPRPECIPSPAGGYWQFSGSSAKWTTETWALEWYSTASLYVINEPGAYANPVQFSPADANMIQSVRNLQLDTPDFDPGRYIWPGSYILSPTLWMRPDRYGTLGGLPTDRADFTRSPMSLRRNRISDVVNPSYKVVLFERFDFKQNTRIASNVVNGAVLRTYKMPPNWNNPTAKPNVVLADGSVRIVDMSVLAYQTGSEGRRTNATLANEMTPCGLFRPAKSDIWNDTNEDGNLELEYGAADSSVGIYRNFFWATRKGVNGRDFSQ